MTWQEQALCRSTDPDLFFPDSTHPEAAAAVAARICAQCPVTAQCAAQALRDDEHHGIWAGVHLGGPGKPARLTRKRAELRAIAENQEGAA